MGKGMGIIKKYSIITFAITSSLLFSSCYETLTIRNGENRKDYYVIWSLSDIQPRELKDREGYETAVRDVKNNLPKPDMAIVAGDIAHDKNSEDDFRWYLETNEKTDIEYWFEITGNHDMKDYDNYLKFIKKPPYYSVAKGNLLILFMSDENRRPPTYISDEAFRWWKRMVIKNQDKIIITVTHGYPENSGLFLASMVKSRTILDSHRFEDVMRKYRVDLWLSGHTHIPSIFGFNECRKKEFNNTTFINISRIRRDMGFNPESRIIILKHNSNLLTVKNRDHHTGKYIKRREVQIELPVPFIQDSRKPELLLPKKD